MGLEEAYVRGLDTRLAALSFGHVVAFCCACCERMAPSYLAHFEGTSEPARDLMLPALARLWDTFDGAALSVPEARRLLKNCDGISFGADNSSAFAPQAESSLGGLISLLTYYAERRVSDARLVARYSSRSIVEWIDYTSMYYLGEHGSQVDDAPLFQLRVVPAPLLLSPDFQHARDDAYRAWLGDHPMVVAERSKQLLDLAVLAAVPSVTSDLARILRESSRTKGVQPFLRRLAARRDK